LRRNQVMHSYWVKEESTENISRIKIKADWYKGIKKTSEDIEMEDLQKLADEVKALHSNLMALASKHKLISNKSITYKI
jgi:hypothetical protein